MVQVVAWTTLQTEFVDQTQLTTLLKQALIWIVMRQISAARAFVNGTLCGPTMVTWDATGTISKVADIQASEAEFDALLVPGFIDLQVNGFGQFNVSSANSAHWSQVDKYLLNSGVTSWCPTLVSAPLDNLISALAMVSSQKQLRTSSETIATTSIIGAHLEGPFLGTAIGAHNKNDVIDIDLQWLSALPACVALMTLGAEQRESVQAIRLLRELGVTVSLGHTRATEQEFLQAKEAGAQMVTHLFNAMSGVHHRNQGVALDVLTDNEMYASIIIDLEHVSAGSVLTMDQALRNAVLHCSVPLDQAIASATKHPAAVLGLKDRGEIARDKRADLVLLGHDLSVVTTVSNGLLNIPING